MKVSNHDRGVRPIHKAITNTYLPDMQYLRYNEVASTITSALTSNRSDVTSVAALKTDDPNVKVRLRPDMVQVMMNFFFRGLALRFVSEY